MKYCTACGTEHVRDTDLCYLCERLGTVGATVDHILEAARQPEPVASIALRSKPADTAETQRLDALERYVFALEDALCGHDPDAPLLRGTWRPTDYPPSTGYVLMYRCSIRRWLEAAMTLRKYTDNQERPPPAPERPGDPNDTF